MKYVFNNLIHAKGKNKGEPIEVEVSEDWIADNERALRKKYIKGIKIARAQNKHIWRLQERNRELAEALAEERRLRKQAWRYYMERLNGRWKSFVDLFYYVKMA